MHCHLRWIDGLLHLLVVLETRPKAGLRGLMMISWLVEQSTRTLKLGLLDDYVVDRLMARGLDYHWIHLVDDLLAIRMAAKHRLHLPQLLLPQLAQLFLQ